MRYPKDHKGATRQRLIGLSGGHAKKHGFNDSGMAALAASAGVSTGALYKHFNGKADLFAALITAEMARTAQLYDGFDPADDASAARSLAGYLSLQHVRHPAQREILSALRQAGEALLAHGSRRASKPAT